LGLKIGVKRVLFNSVKSNRLHLGTYTVEGDDEDIRTDGRNTKNRWSFLPLPQSRTNLRLLPFWAHTRAVGEVRRRGIVHMGCSAVSYEISIHQKRMPQNNSLKLWRPRFLETISFGSFSNSITFVCETRAGWTGLFNETF